jgi:hypothetical protein
MHRTTLISDLRKRYGCRTQDALVAELQRRGQISDLCVTVDDIADGDLIRAHNRIYEIQIDTASREYNNRETPKANE